MKRLPDTASKSDEMAHWLEFLNQLPPCSYLSLYLQDSAPLIEEAMRNDLSCNALGDLRKQRATAQQDVNDVRKLLAEMQGARDALKQQIDGLKRDAAHLRDAFDEAKSAARILLKQADESHARGVTVIARATA